MNIIFAGTPDFAVPALQALIDSEHQVIAVYTQPDRRAGRGRKLHASPVKQLALKYDIAVYQPQNFKTEQDQQDLIDLSADLMVVAAYGLLLPQVILDAPQQGCINIHASLLPRWRGAAPIHRAILAGDKETGITIMQMALGLDTGDMLLKKICPIRSDDSSATLHGRLATIGATALLQVLNNFGQLEPKPQNDTDSIYAHKLEKSEAQLNWQQPAVELNRQVRAFNPWPVAQTELEGLTLRIWQTKVIASNSDCTVGQIVKADKTGIQIQTGEGILQITRLQKSGKKQMAVADFLNSQQDFGKNAC